MIALRIDPETPAAVWVESIDAIKSLAVVYPGDEQLVLLVGAHRLEIGPGWRFDGSRECLEALSRFGTVEQPTTQTEDP